MLTRAALTLISTLVLAVKTNFSDYLKALTLPGEGGVGVGGDIPVSVEGYQSEEEERSVVTHAPPRHRTPRASGGRKRARKAVHSAPVSPPQKRSQLHSGIELLLAASGQSSWRVSSSNLKIKRTECFTRKFPRTDEQMNANLERIVQLLKSFVRNIPVGGKWTFRIFTDKKISEIN